MDGTHWQAARGIEKGRSGWLCGGAVGGARLQRDADF